MFIQIRKATIDEAQSLTKIAFESKKTWNYPMEYMEIWKDELTINDEYIEKNFVFAAERRKQLLGFISIVLIKEDSKFGKVLVKKGYWLDHLFVLPKFQNRRIGMKLMKQAFLFCEENWIDELSIFVDPYAVGFYEKMGAEFVQKTPSSIEGREIPIYKFSFNPK